MKVITFDFWNTLFLDQHEEIRQKKRKSFALNVLKRHHAAIEFAHLDAAFLAADQAFNTQWDHRRASTMKFHVEQLLSNLSAEIPESDFMEIVEYFETVLLEHMPAIILNAAEGVKHAGTRSKLGLISDTGYSPGRTLRRVLNHFGLESSFQAFSFSNETGYLKPTPECFYRILRELNVSPQDCIHIGDLEDTDIAGAKKVGMKAIKYIGSNPGAARSRLPMQ